MLKKMCARWVTKHLTPEHKVKYVESALKIVVHLFLHLKKFLFGQRQRFQHEREAEKSGTQRFQTQAADFYVTGI